ncbi:MAG TPA: PASTA domain-containing protein, partial [Acidimicrobiia bacterium]|nr:PASTA domain-containing protein [Acidimicrobiia bacterium]
GPGIVDFDPHPTEIRPAEPTLPPGPVGPLPSVLASPVAPPDVAPAEPPLVAIPVLTTAAPPRAHRAEKPQARRRGPQRVIPIVVLAVLLIAAGTAAFAAVAATGPRVPVPNFVGAGERAADQAAKDARVKLRKRMVASDDPAGTVIRQDPEPGTLLGAHKAVTLQLSQGPPPVELPELVGKTEAEARTALDAAGFVVTTERRTDENVAAGRVAAQSPSQDKASPGSEVHLVISDGPKPVEVPNVVGKTYDEAAKTLTAKRFKVSRTEEYSDTVPAGQVIRTGPVANAEAPRDSTVSVVVSLGPDLVTVGDYEGETVEDAVFELEEAGLQVDVVDYRPRRRVRHQDPPPGTRVRRNETVTLYL